jgi:flavodoxin
MNSIVIYASHFGNTMKAAEAIGDGLRLHGMVRLLAVDEAPSRIPAGTDLVVIGGPTEAMRMTPPMRQFLDRLETGALQGVAAAAFDTRLHMPRWLLGSAAVGIERRLHEAGAQVIAPQESFFVVGKDPELVPGELERAKVWGASLGAAVEAKSAQLVGATR